MRVVDSSIFDHLTEEEKKDPVVVAQVLIEQIRKIADIETNQIKRRLILINGFNKLQSSIEKTLDETKRDKNIIMMQSCPEGVDQKEYDKFLEIVDQKEKFLSDQLKLVSSDAKIILSNNVSEYEKHFNEKMDTLYGSIHATKLDDKKFMDRSINLKNKKKELVKTTVDILLAETKVKTKPNLVVV